VDPNAAIREEYTSFRIKTKDKQILVGLITERTAEQIALVDSAQKKTIIPKSQIEDERALQVSIMPEELLSGLSDQDLRDLFKYLSSDGPLRASAP
jgi:putative heme-binding domain-containing protein